MIATTSKQSERLVACGVSCKTADMVYMPYGTLSAVPFSDELGERQCKPAWSLSAVLNILPKHLDDFPFTKWYQPFLDNEIEEIYSEEVLNGDVKLYFNGTNWIVDYDWDGFSGSLPQSENPIEAVVLAIELLHANGYDFANIKSTNHSDNVSKS